MKKSFIPLICATALLTVSCSDKLEIPQKGVVAYEDFYKTDEDAEGALVAMYDVFAQNIARPNGESIICPYIALFNLPGDDVYAAGEFYGDNDFNAQINEFRFDANAQLVVSMYKGFYQMIYGANLVIDNFSGNKADTEIKKRAVAEARTIRAWAHMMLAIGWGTPPLIDKVIVDAPSNYNGTQEELLAWCGKEALAAVADLRERTSTADKNGTSYVTKGFAQYVAGKAYLFAGDYEEAEAALKPLVTSDKYALVPGDRIRETFHLVGEGNEEYIFAANINNNPAIGDWAGKIQKTTWMHMDIWGWRTDHWGGTPSLVRGGWGGLGVRADFAEALIANDGYDSYRRRAWVKQFDPEVLYEMAYPTDTTQTLEQKKQGSDRGIKTYLYGQSEYLQYKRVSDNADYDNWYSTLNVLIARQAEAYLMYAEAAARTSSTSDDALGLQLLNDVQNRAGSQKVSATLNLQDVKEEKRFEMFMEGCRWADLVRYYKVDGDQTVINNLKDNGKDVPQLYDTFWGEVKDGSTTYPKTAEHNIITIMQHPNAGKKVGFDENIHTLFPFPGAAVMAINPNMDQNDGY